MKRLYFVRHGQTEWNVASRMQGQWNSDLTPLGRRQADVSGRLLAQLAIDTLFSSPLDRARQTVEIVNQYLQLPVVFDDRIQEWDCGDWSGYLRKAVKTKWPHQWAARKADRYHFRGPNCENYPDMIARTTPFLGELKAHASQNVAIVSHSIIGRVMVSTLLGHAEMEYLSYRQPNDVIYRVTLSGVGAAVDHFAGLEGPFPGVIGQE